MQKSMQKFHLESKMNESGGDRMAARVALRFPLDLREGGIFVKKRVKGYNVK